jgi:hypothetical protein
MSRNKFFIQQKVEQLVFDNRFHHFTKSTRKSYGAISARVSIFTLFKEWSYESLQPNRWKIVMVHALVEYEG